MSVMLGTDLEGIMKEIPMNEKYTLSIKEAAAYFGIGIKKMRSWQRNTPVPLPY